MTKIRNFWYIFDPKVKQYLQNLAWGTESQVCTLMPNFAVVVTTSKVVKTCMFCCTFVIQGIFWGSTKNLNIGAQLGLQTFFV